MVCCSGGTHPCSVDTGIGISAWCVRSADHIFRLELVQMTEAVQARPLATVYQGWDEFQRDLLDAVVPPSPEQ